MNTNELIFKAFNKNKNESSWDDNVYKPNIKVKSTIKPNKKHSFNEISQHINEQLKKIRK